MSEPATRAQFVDYCKRRLGHPVIEINVDDDQVDDRIDDALQFYQDYHYDATEKLYLKHLMTQEDHTRRYLLVPDKIIGITRILDFDGSAASTNMFDLRYQLRLHDLYDFTSVSYVNYEITMQHLRTLNLLFSGTPIIRFQRHKNRLQLDVNWDSDVPVGSYVIIECYGKINPDRITVPGTFTLTTGNNNVLAVGAVLDGVFTKDDEIVFVTANGEISTRVSTITSNANMTVSTVFANTETAATAYIPGNSDVWNDRVLKDLATAYIKRQWGLNLKKFGGIQLPGGTFLNGQIIYDEAEAEIKEMKAEFISYNTLPNEFIMG